MHVQLNILPTVFTAVAYLLVVLFSGRLIIRFYALIVVSYLNVFPFINYLLSEVDGSSPFVLVQWTVIALFEIPLLLLMIFWRGHCIERVSAVDAKQDMQLSWLLPMLLAFFLALFWYVSFKYGLFFRRITHESLQDASRKTPGILLYAYRATVDSSFFVISLLGVIVARVRETARYFTLYKLLLVSYLLSFSLFFIINSRMQFGLLIIVLAITMLGVSEKNINFKKAAIWLLLLLMLIVGLTMLREFVLERNGRVNSDSWAVLLLSLIKMISARLDSLSILYELSALGEFPIGFNLYGYARLLDFYWSFFFDPSKFSAIKESLVTSPSVAITNIILGQNMVDYPKSMVLDLFLSFGLLGLPLAAVFLYGFIHYVQERILYFKNFNFGYLLAIYLLPFILEFEKEFAGMIFSALKWSPVFFVVYGLRPINLERPVDDSSSFQRKSGVMP